MKKDIEIAQEATIKPIIDIAATIGFTSRRSRTIWGSIKQKSIGQQSKSRNAHR